MTQEYKGKSVYKGIALGPVVVFQKNDVQVKREKITDAEGEIARMQDAVSASQENDRKSWIWKPEIHSVLHRKGERAAYHDRRAGTSDRKSVV